MATKLRAAASRFYGMPVSREILSAKENEDDIFRERDLVKAHISTNYCYFGLIDKTLSGFVILDQEGDNSYLLDLRDTGQVYWQDHETREISLQFATLGDYRDKSEDWSPWKKARRTKKEEGKAKKSTKVVATDDLADRYRWLVRFYSRLTNRREHFKKYVRKAQPVDEMLWLQHYEKEERSALATDTHLALYWLLHWSAYTDLEKVEDVIAAAGSRQPELFTAFSQRFSGLQPGDTLKDILPSFRQRRALFMFANAIARRGKDMAKIILSLEMDPKFLGLEKLFHIANPEERQVFTMHPECLGVFPQKLYCIGNGRGPSEQQVNELERIVTRMRGAGATRTFTQALIDKWRGKKESEAAGQFAHLCLEGNIAREHLDAFSMIGALIADPKLVIAASDVLLKEDPYCYEILKLLSAGLRQTGENDRAASVENLCERLDTIGPVYIAYTSGAEKLRDFHDCFGLLPKNIQNLLREAWQKEAEGDRDAIDETGRRSAGRVRKLHERHSAIRALSDQRSQAIAETEKSLKHVEDLPDENKRLFAERVLYACRDIDEALTKSLIWILQLGSPHRAELLARVFKRFTPFPVEDLFRRMREAVPHPNGALAADLRKVRSSFPPKKNDKKERAVEEIVGEMDRDEIAKAITAWIGAVEEIP